MSIHGAVEQIAPNRVSGWCVDTKSKEPVSVELYVDSVRLMAAPANAYRHDIRKAMRRPFAGFDLPISSALRRLLPHGSVMKVVANGVSLEVLSQCNPLIDNPAVTSLEALRDKLDAGYIITPKYGRIFLPIKERIAEKGWMTQALESIEAGGRIFQEATGKQLFIGYGTLLGFVRSGDFIEHDDDVDLCFLADADGWEGAFEEFMQIVGDLRARGERIGIDSAIQFHWYLKGIALDVFMGWMEGKRLNMYNVHGVLPRSRMFPLRQQRLKGAHVWVPKEPEAMLALIYGEGWRIPDPNFQWQPVPELGARRKLYAEATQRIRLEEARHYWSSFYKRFQRTAVPSSFAASVATELAEPCWMVDMGCGDGRDSFFFAAQGHRVLGLDAAGEVIDGNRAFADDAQGGRVAFRQADVSAPGVLASVLHDAVEANASGAGMVVYGRFFFHAVSETEETVVLEALAELPAGARCYFEFRTTQDAGLTKWYPGHYRRFIDLGAFVEKAAQAGKLDCLYSMEGQGMAKYGEEDPFVGRVHLRRR